MKFDFLESLVPRESMHMFNFSVSLELLIFKELFKTPYLHRGIIMMTVTMIKMF